MVELLTGPRLPAGLLDLKEGPEAMYLQGQLPPGPIVALVGTRKATAKGIEFTEKLAFDLARSGVLVASGGAEGIDTAAHRGALDANAPTLVVAPSSWDRPYPEKNATLYKEIVSRGGGYLSVHPSGTPATQGAFFPRNSHLVALASALVVVEAPIRSGARNAAQWARRLGRELFAVPYAPWDTHGAGCVLELRLGARVLTSHRDVLRRLRQLNRHAIERPIGATPDPEQDTELDLQLPLLE